MKKTKKCNVDTSRLSYTHVSISKLNFSVLFQLNTLDHDITTFIYKYWTIIVGYKVFAIPVMGKGGTCMYACM